MAILWNIRIAQGLCALLSCFAAQATSLRFIIPSGATSETSRFYSQLIREFEQANPDIQIGFEPLTNWDDVVTKVQLLARQQQSAGVFIAEVSETLELEHQGLITPFADAAASARDGLLRDFQAALIPQFLGNSYCASKKFCAPPFVRSTPVALYNLELLKHVGIDKNHLPNTWDDLEVLLLKLNKQTHQPPFGLGGDWYDYLFEAMVRQAGGSLFDAEHNRITFNTPEAVKALTFWQRLKAKRLLIRANNWKATLNGFSNGRYAVTYYSSGGMETVRKTALFPWIADMLPRGKVYGVAVGGGNLYLSSRLSEQQKNAALRFTQFLYIPAVQARISLESGFFPVVEAAFNEPALKARYSQDEPFVRVKRQLKFAKAKIMSTDNLRARDLLKKAIDRCLDEGVPAQLALQQAQQQIDRTPGNDTHRLTSPPAHAQNPSPSQ